MNTAESNVLEINLGERDRTLLAPIPGSLDCGEDLEYHPEFILLQAKSTPRPEMQYGSFMAAPEPVNWREVETDCMRLLATSKDMRVAILLVRSRVHLTQFAGLRDGLALLCAMLRRFGPQLHPQATVDGITDPLVRANVLAGLAESGGLLADLRGLVVSSTAAARLTVREIERALSIPRPPDALNAQDVLRRIAELKHAADPQMVTLADCTELVFAIERWSLDALQQDAPDLSGLRRLLAPFADERSFTNAGASMADSAFAEPAETVVPTAPEPARSSDVRSIEHNAAASPEKFLQPAPHDRQSATQAMRNAREWFERNEPSSPIPILLQACERMVGQRFTALARSLPLELLERWEPAD